MKSTDRLGIPLNKELSLKKSGTIPYAGLERRCGKDRRSHSPPLLQKLFAKGRRKSSRRVEDRRRIVLFDRYPRPLFIGTLAVLILSLLDAALTLVLLSQGAIELNPVMLYYLGHGPMIFLFVKYGLTVLSVFIVVVSYDALIQRYLIGSKLLPLFAILFGGVVVWELYLLSII
jgi:hypothetical protein